MAEQESEYVKLISSDGFEFIIHREAAMRSGTIKNMLSGAGKCISWINFGTPGASSTDA